MKNNSKSIEIVNLLPETNYKTLEMFGYPNHRISNKAVVEYLYKGIWFPACMIKKGKRDTLSFYKKSTKGHNSTNQFSLHHLFYAAWTGDNRSIKEYRLFAKDGNCRNYDLNNFEWVKRNNEVPYSRKIKNEQIDIITKNVDLNEYRLLDFTGYKGYRINKTGIVESCRSGVWQVLRGCVHKDRGHTGALTVNFNNNSAKKGGKNFFVYQLFYKAWGGKDKTCKTDKLYPKDGNYFNYDLNNFEWKLIKSGQKLKFTMEIANKIREDYSKENVSSTQLVKKYKLSQSTILKIVNNKIYVDPNYTFTKKSYNFKRKLSTEDIKEIRRLFSMGILTQQQIAEKFNATQSWISFIVRNKYRVKS